MDGQEQKECLAFKAIKLQLCQMCVSCTCNLVYNQDEEFYWEHNPSTVNDCSDSGLHVTAHISDSNGLLGTGLPMPGSCQCHITSKDAPTQTTEARKTDSLTIS